MRIDEVSSASGLSADTIRFYEKSGMLPAIERDTRGWRRFSADNLQWLTTLERLRATGMPLAEVKAFAASAQGPNCDSLSEQAKRLEILERHALTLADRRAELDTCEAFLKHKINFYRSRTRG